MATNSKILNDKEVIENLSANIHLDDTIKYLYRAHFEYVGRFVVNNSGDWEDAEDIFQEVIISFLHLVKAGKFRGEASIKTFLYSLNRNLWLNELKRRGRAEARETKFEATKDLDEQGILTQIENREANEGLMKVIDELGETCKKILLLFYYENRSMKEMMTELHYENEQVIRNKKYKCLKKLEQMLADNKSLYNKLKNYLHG